jgi:branched-chain amino acid transport system substrate-binding protein
MPHLPAPKRVGRRRLRWAGAAVSALLALAAAGCSGGDGEATTTTSTIAPTTTTIAPRTNDRQLKIGVFLPQTGPGAALGSPMIAAIEDAIGEINAAGGVLGSDVTSEAIDESAGTGLDGLLDLGVDAIVGPASSTVALAHLAEAVHPVTGVVTCSPTATALSLDNFPDNKLFFRTIPSDSLQMAAMVRRVEATGLGTVAVGYLDDPYGRALKNAFADRVEARGRVTMLEPVGFSADDDDLSDVVAELLQGEPGVIVVLGDADDGTRLLAAIDETAGSSPTEVVVNEAIRGGRQAIQALSPAFRVRVSGVAPMATTVRDDGPDGFYAANAKDCVNLIALAAIEANSDAPAEIQKYMAAASADGRMCTSFADCANTLAGGFGIDYTGYSGDVELSTTTGELAGARFEVFEFDAQGNDYRSDQTIEVP